MLSNMSSHARPTWGIWIMWSITVTVEKPTCSAVRAVDASHGPSPGVPPGAGKLERCRPKRRVMGSSR